jgi:hypothetical protein
MKKEDKTKWEGYQMSLDEAYTFFRGTMGETTNITVFLDPKEAVDTAKKMIELAGGEVKITIPFDDDGEVNEDDVVVNEKEAKKYVEKYDGEEVGGICQRYLDFYSGEEGTMGKTLSVETYERVGGDYAEYDAVHVLMWG